MTIENTRLANVYHYFLNDHNDRTAQPVLLAEAADRYIGEMIDSANYDGIKCPGDDRMMNVELAVFNLLLQGANIQWQDLELETAQ